MQKFTSKNKTHSLFIIEQKWSTKYSYNTHKKLLENLHKKTKNKMKHWINTTIKNNKNKKQKKKTKKRIGKEKTSWEMN